MRQSFRRIQVAEVIDETPDTRSVVLVIPPELAAEFAYRPGQFLTVRVPGPTGAPLARCYSLSSAPSTDAAHTITVKRTRDGRVSNWICDHVTAGAVLDVLPPAGSFTPARVDDDLLLFAGGSGITPLLSIIKAALNDGSGHVALVYANRDAESVIFAATLTELRQRYPERLEVRHWHDATEGLPTVEAIARIVEPYRDREIFVCGPEPYMDLVARTLEHLGAPDHRVHIERFTVVNETAVGAATATAEVTLDGQTHRLPWPADKRLLDVLIDAGLNPPYSCRQGICGACACVLVSGKVDLVHNEVLEEEDFADGYTLACQALPVSETVTITYS